jgi:hypothetical protein
MRSSLVVCRPSSFLRRSGIEPFILRTILLVLQYVFSFRLSCQCGFLCGRVGQYNSPSQAFAASSTFVDASKVQGLQGLLEVQDLLKVQDLLYVQDLPEIEGQLQVRSRFKLEWCVR